MIPHDRMNCYRVDLDRSIGRRVVFFFVNDKFVKKSRLACESIILSIVQWCRYQVKFIPTNTLSEKPEFPSIQYIRTNPEENTRKEYTSTSSSRNEVFDTLCVSNIHGRPVERFCSQSSSPGFVCNTDVNSGNPTVYRIVEIPGNRKLFVCFRARRR